GRATPLRELLRRHPVSLRHLTDPDTWRQALPYDPRLDLVRPSASSSTAGHHFHPANEAVPPRCLRFLHRQPPAVKERSDWMAGDSYETESSMGVKPRLRLTSTELDHICDLAASLGKDMALEGNFGMGAKVASLPSNTLGMRYRSCRDGVVSQVVLGKRE